LKNKLSDQKNNVKVENGLVKREQRAIVLENLVQRHAYFQMTYNKCF
jgi:hypothetical protein